MQRSMRRTPRWRPNPSNSSNPGPRPGLEELDGIGWLPYPIPIHFNGLWKQKSSISVRLGFNPDPILSVEIPPKPRIREVRTPVDGAMRANLA